MKPREELAQILNWGWARFLQKRIEAGCFAYGLMNLLYGIFEDEKEDFRQKAFEKLSKLGYI